MADVSYSLDQIVGLLTQQAQLLRSMKESGGSFGVQQAPFFSTVRNPFSGGESGANPFSTGYANATGATSGGFFNRSYGLPSAAQLGVGLGASFFQRKIFNTDVSTLGTVPPITSFGFFQNSSKISQDQRMMAAANFGDKWSTGTLNFAGSALNVAGSMLGFSNPLGWALMAGGAVVNIGADQVKQQNAYNKYLLQNSYRFINYGESTNTRGMGGFGAKERMEAANYLRRFGTENLISDTDTQMLLKKFTEGDLLRNTKDLQSFKVNMEQLTKAVKEGAIALGETYESMAGLMSDMKKLGMDPTRAGNYAASAKALQGMTGLDGSTTMTGILNAAGAMTQGTGISSSAMYSTLEDNLLLTNALYDKMYDRANNNDPHAKRAISLISNLGGVENAYQQVGAFEQRFLTEDTVLRTLGFSFFDYDGKGGFTFNQDKYNSFLSGDADINKLRSQATDALNAAPTEAKAIWMRQGHEFMLSNLDGGQLMQTIAKYLDGLQEGSQFKGQDLTTVEQLKLLLGENGADAELFGLLNDENLVGILNEHKSLSARQELINVANANAKGAGYRLTNWWSGAKDSVGDWFSPMAAWGQEMGVGFNNWWKGYQYNISDLQKPSGATDMEDSKDYLIGVFDEISASMKRLGGEFDDERQKIDAYRNKLATSDIVGEEYSTKDVQANILHEVATASKSWGIKDEEKSNYNQYLRDYLEVDDSASDYQLLEQGAKEFRNLYERNGADYSKYSQAELKFIKSFSTMHSDYITSDEQKFGSKADKHIDKTSEGPTSGSGMNSKEMLEQARNIDVSLHGGGAFSSRVLPGGHLNKFKAYMGISEYTNKEYSALSSGGLEGLHAHYVKTGDNKAAEKTRKYIEELEGQKEDYERGAQEVKANVEETNALASYLNNEGIIGEEQMKRYQMGEDTRKWYTLGLYDPDGKAEDYSFEDAAKSRADMESYIASSLRAGGDTANRIRRDMAEHKIDISQFESRSDDTEYINNLAHEYTNAILGSDTDLDTGNESSNKKIDKTIDGLDSSLGDFTTSVENYTTRINNAADKLK